MLAFIEWTAKRRTARLCMARYCSVGCTVPPPTPTEDSLQLCLVRCETASSITVKIGRAVRLVVHFPTPPTSDQTKVHCCCIFSVPRPPQGAHRTLSTFFRLFSRSNELYRSAAQRIFLKSHAALIETPVVWSRLAFIWISSQISGKAILDTLPPGPGASTLSFV